MSYSQRLSTPGLSRASSYKQAVSNQSNTIKPNKYTRPTSRGGAAVRVLPDNIGSDGPPVFPDAQDKTNITLNVDAGGSAVCLDYGMTRPSELIA